MSTADRLPSCIKHPKQRYNFNNSHRVHSCPDCYNIVWEGPAQNTLQNQKMGKDTDDKLENIESGQYDEVGRDWSESGNLKEEAKDNIRR